MHPHLISSAVYIPKETPTSRRHGTTFGGLMVNKRVCPGRHFDHSLQPKLLRRGKHHALPAAGGQAGPGGTTAAEGRLPPPTQREWYRPPSGRAVRRCRHGGAAAEGQLLAASSITEQAVLLSGREARKLPVRLCRSRSRGKRRSRRR